MKYYYIVDSYENYSFEKGFHQKKGDGIYVLDSLDLVEVVAMNELRLCQFILLEIDSSGITGKITKSDTWHWADENQFTIIQDAIAPEFIEFLGEYEIELGETEFTNGLDSIKIRDIIRCKENDESS